MSQFFPLQSVCDSEWADWPFLCMQGAGLSLTNTCGWVWNGWSARRNVMSPDSLFSHCLSCYHLSACASASRPLYDRPLCTKTILQETPNNDWESHFSASHPELRYSLCPLLELHLWTGELRLLGLSPESVGDHPRPKQGHRMMEREWGCGIKKRKVHFENRAKWCKWSHTDIKAL